MDSATLKMSFSMRNYLKPNGLITHFLVLLGSTCFPFDWAIANSTSQAYRIHKRLTGVHPDQETLSQMNQLIDQDKALDAAFLAIDNEKQSYFYNITLKQFFSKWFDEEGSVAIPLNDATATLIGFVRDGRSMQNIFTTNVIYIGSNLPESIKTTIRPPEEGNNLHYQTLESRNIDLKKHLTPVSRTSIALDPDQMLANHDTVPAGIFTTRAFAQAYYNAGTNRAPVRYTLKNFLCEDIDAFHDTTIPDIYVRRDPDRAPGGDSTVFKNHCVGCHAGMDPLTPAFAYLDWNDDKQRLEFTKPLPSTPHDKTRCADQAEITLTLKSDYNEKLRCSVVKKYLNNKDSFPSGFVVTSDHWRNLWNRGSGARVGWPGDIGSPLEGHGPKAFGIMIAQTKAFPRCMVKQVMEHVCFATDFLSPQIKDKMERLTDDFISSEYNMKKLFAQTAVLCKGN